MLPFFTWLRELSLSGSAGNAAAWALVLLASALPLVPAILLLLRRRRWTDALLLLLPPTIFAALYFGVNPTLVGPVGQFLPVAALGCAASVLLAWVVLGLLRNLAAAPADKLARALGILPPRPSGRATPPPPPRRRRRSGPRDSWPCCGCCPISWAAEPCCWGPVWRSSWGRTPSGMRPPPCATAPPGCAAWPPQPWCCWSWG